MKKCETLWFWIALFDYRIKIHRAPIKFEFYEIYRDEITPNAQIKFFVLFGHYCKPKDTDNDK